MAPSHKSGKSSGSIPAAAEVGAAENSTPCLCRNQITSDGARTGRVKAGAPSSEKPKRESEIRRPDTRWPSVAMSLRKAAYDSSSAGAGVGARRASSAEPAARSSSSSSRFLERARAARASHGGGGGGRGSRRRASRRGEAQRLRVEGARREARSG
eukprot:scaffold273389_cov29-Tisochrysis_lutea.AAC.1